MTAPVKARRQLAAGGTLNVEVVQLPGDIVLLVCCGVLDTTSSSALLGLVGRVLRGGARRVCIDLCAVADLDAAGIAALIGVRRLALSADTALVLCSLGRARQQLFAAGAEPNFSIRSTRQLAIRSLT